MSKEIYNFGNPQSPVWVVVNSPYPKDAEHRYLFSCGYGVIFHRMMKEAGFDKNYYICSRKPNLERPSEFQIVESDMANYKPPVIIALGDVASYLSNVVRDENSKSRKKPTTNANGEVENWTTLDKFAGSILSSELSCMNYPHYVIPTYPPDKIVLEWSLRDIVVNLDLGKAKSELDYWLEHGTLQPLPKRQLEFNMTFSEIMSHLKSFRDPAIKYLSNDIESVYPRKTSQFYPHPGLPVCLGLAPSKDFGISFPLFWENPEQNVILWREVNRLLKNKIQIGQNFFNYDAPRLNMLGFDIDVEKNVSDTMLRHQFLWPELPHKLQFLTRQYTREPYYKDEGHGWSLKDQQGLRRYNCLDVCVTYEVWEKQQEEIDAR